jgi:fatty acid desaturase
VTAITSSGRSLIGVVIGSLHARSRARTGQPSRLAAAIRDHAMTFAALAAADVAGFRLWHAGGWFVLAVTLLLADFKIQPG